MSQIRTYRELSRLNSFKDRYNYLKLKGQVGKSTFGFDRWINQRFYGSHEWNNIRNQVICRDNGCDLGIPDYDIYGGLLVHHMNAVTVDDIFHGEDWILDPEYLITTSLQTHNAIHFGDETCLPRGPTVRRPGDTTLWTPKRSR